MKNKFLTFITISMLVFCGLAYCNNSNKAIIEIVDYGSIECDDSRDFYLENGDLLLSLYHDNKIIYTFKPVDLNDFLYDKEIYERMTSKHLEFPNLVSIFKHQDKWNNLDTLDDIITYLKLNSTPIGENTSNLEKSESEIQELSLKSFPAIYINGTLIDYKIKNHQLRELLSKT